MVMKPTFAMRLVVVSHVVHYRFEGRLFAYGPYAREIALWAGLFEEIAIASPCRTERPPADALPLEAGNISILPQVEAGGDTFAGKLQLLVRLPVMIVRLLKALAGADAIHVRCPGNLGLLGAVLAPLFGKPLIAKYAAQWSGARGEGRLVRLQKWLLASAWWRGPVTVYGEWPEQPAHVIPFFTSLLSAEQMERARASAVRERERMSWNVLYTGRLSQSKHVDTVLRALAAARQAGYPMTATVVGEGPERASLEALAEELNLQNAVEFTGGLAFDGVLERLERADILALVSETEGWPKSIAEAMAFGLIAIGSDRGFVPKMLADGRGLTLPPGDAEELTRCLLDIARNPERYDKMRGSAAEWAQQFSLEGLREAIRKLLLASWTCGAPVAGIGPIEEKREAL
jgi:glycosyltransferase involved in cell wall biosynthesis